MKIELIHGPRDGQVMEIEGYERDLRFPVYVQGTMDEHGTVHVPVDVYVHASPGRWVYDGYYE